MQTSLSNTTVVSLRRLPELTGSNDKPKQINDKPKQIKERLDK